MTIPSRGRLPSSAVDRPPIADQAQAANAGLAAAVAAGRFIYIAGPCTPMGGGMFRIAQYLVQCQRKDTDGPALRLLETRGGGSALWSPFHLLRAIGLVMLGRATGKLAGVHVNGAERLSILRKGVLMAACRVLGVPVVFHLHAAQLPRTYQAAPALARLLIRWIFRLPSCSIVLGRNASDFLVRDLGVDPDRVVIVFNGVPEPEHVVAGERSAGFQLLFIGNLSERKGVSDLLHALQDVRFANIPLLLTLAGGGEVDRYKALAAQLGVEGKARFLGWTDKAMLDRLLAGADALVLPSYHEGLPLAILEALARGVPVVCTPVGEIAQVLADGHTALFVQPGDREGLATALLRVLQERPLRARLGRAGRAVYEAQFSLQRFAASVARVHHLYFGFHAFGL